MSHLIFAIHEELTFKLFILASCQQALIHYMLD